MIRWLGRRCERRGSFTGDLRHGMVEALTDVVVAIMIAFVVYAIGLRLTAENFCNCSPHPCDRLGG